MNLDDAKDRTILPAIIQVGIAFAIIWYLDSNKLTSFFALYNYRDKLHELSLIGSLIGQSIYQFALRHLYRNGFGLSLYAAILLGGFAPLFPLAAFSVLLWSAWPTDCDNFLGTIPLICYLAYFVMTMYTVRYLAKVPPSGDLKIVF